jgi:hypothetical protein
MGPSRCCQFICVLVTGANTEDAEIIYSATQSPWQYVLSGQRLLQHAGLESSLEEADLFAQSSENEPIAQRCILLRTIQ